MTASVYISGKMAVKGVLIPNVMLMKRMCLDHNVVRNFIVRLRNHLGARKERGLFWSMGYGPDLVPGSALTYMISVMAR